MFHEKKSFLRFSQKSVDTSRKVEYNIVKVKELTPPKIKTGGTANGGYTKKPKTRRTRHSSNRLRLSKRSSLMAQTSA